ncbi:bifunctional DNA primase/polymerase [Allonocardiopsis opalescens]|uniref:Bifunctional DNA primase/polymerase-like protein n=1 Tax=Allonocardiopsis opalescens TaxID=1144618 RepID=A0A2T0Q833_9ACTN|nr:bifunctional DNA primase/polymerase [Allonocardiopsis opalescens]PRX99893.1 bifunctional DNA primase/polymerase-like protein [Allonocardiopsis opalescens]
MVELVTRKGQQRGPSRTLAAALEYAALGWPVCPGAYPLRDGPRACSCDRIGCPDPGGHPASAVWGWQATTEPETIGRWWAAEPEANIVLPTGRVFDVFDVPAAAGVMALARMGRAGVHVGPVAAYDAQRYLFFVATRGAPEDEDEWWSCHLDCFPETNEDAPGLRWHCRDSYVIAPPSRLPSSNEVAWIRRPVDRELPDPIVVLDILVDACDEM